MSRRPYPLTGGASTPAAATHQQENQGTPAEGTVVKITGLTSARTQIVAHKLGRRFAGMAVSRTFPAGRDGYLYYQDGNAPEKFITFASLTAATVTYYALVY